MRAFSPNQQGTSCIRLNSIEPRITPRIRRGSYRRLDSGVRRPYSIPAAASARQCDLSATFWTYPSSSDAPAFPDGIKKAEHPERNPSLLEFAVMATVRTNKLSIFILVHQVGLDFLYFELCMYGFRIKLLTSPSGRVGLAPPLFLFRHFDGWQPHPDAVYRDGDGSLLFM